MYGMSYNEYVIEEVDGKIRYTNKKRVFEQPFSGPKRGIIIGGTWLCEGTGLVSSYDDPGFFDVKNKVFVYQVRESFTGKPILCQVHQLRRITNFGNRVKFKDDFSFQLGMTKKVRKMLSEDMKKCFIETPELFPRDEKGRFKKVEF